MRGRWFSLALLVFACVALFGGLTWLVQMRFESGEVYPRGSSLRADPLGSKALYASFEALESIEVSRNFVPFDQLEQLEPDASVLLLNLHGAGMHGLVQNERIERFVEQGGRLVCALNANTVAYKYLTEEDEDRDTSDEMREPVDDREQAVFKRKAKERTERFWAGLNLIHGEHEGGDAEIADAALVTDLPPRIPWREGAIVDFETDVWTVLYEVEGEAVVVERAYGAGSVLVLTDDYLFSNEALLKHRYPELLAWLVGAQVQVIFDETHLGVSQRTGVSTLMRRYRLNGFMLALGCLMLLLVWRGGAPLLPAYRSLARRNIVRSEHSTEAGLSDLIRRSVPAGQLPEEAFRHWKASCIRTAADEAYYAAELRDIEALLREVRQTPDRKRKPMDVHFKIESILNRKKRRRL